MSPDRGPLTAVLLIGALVRLLLIVSFHGQPIFIADAREYNAIALNVCERGEFSVTPGQPTSIRPPLYPAFLAGTYRVMGGENQTAARVVQAVLGLLTALIVYHLAKAMYGAPAATWAAAGVCFYPSLVFTGNLLLTETLFTFWLCLFCWLIQRHLTTAGVGALFAAGAVLGLAALTRSVVWLFPPLLVLFLFWAAKGRRGTARVTLALAPVLAFGLVIAPWAVRNTRLQKTFTIIDVMGGRNMMMGNYESTSLLRSWATIDEAQGARAWYRVLAAEHPDFPQLTQGQRDKLAMKRGLQFVFQHPGLTAQRDLIKFLNFWQLDRAIVAGFAQGFWGNQSRAVALAIGGLMAGAYVAVMLLAILGFVMTRPVDARMHWFLFLLVAFVCAAHTAVFGHERYRLPLMPLIIIYAAACVVNWREIWRQRTRFVSWFAAGLCLLLIASWVAELAFVEWPRIRNGLL